MNTTDFTAYRGGCIACMDYSFYAMGPPLEFFYTYISLSARFKDITTILTKKLQQFNRQGFSYEHGMLFGFSFGGQLVLESGRAIDGKLKEIDGKT